MQHCFECRPKSIMRCKLRQNREKDLRIDWTNSRNIHLENINREIWKEGDVLHIALDLDNTILDATTSHLKCYNEISGMSLTNDDATDFYLYRLYGWDHEKRDKVYSQYGHEIHLNSIPYSKAVETIQRLFNKHQISIITARPLMFKDVSIKWLNDHNIPYHNITFTENKLQKCEDSKVDVLIDDGPHYALQFSKKQKPVILFQQPYNLSVTNRFVYPISHWSEAEKYIDLIQMHKMHARNRTMY